MFYKTFFLLLSAFIIPSCYSQNACATDSANYYSCIANQRKANPWAYRRPYQNFDEVARCLIDAGCTQPDYKRGLFVDFIKAWQEIANKIWNEFINTPENVKECIRLILVKYSRSRLDQCVQSVGGTPVGAYPEDVELPFCGLRMPKSTDLELMKTSLFEKVNVLHEINSCKENKGEAAATQASTCLDAIRHDYMVKNFCNTSASCLKRVTPTCSSAVPRTTVAMCQCARNFRDHTILTLDNLYATQSINVMKLVPAFLGVELTPEINGQFKKCYTDNGLQPISLLNFFDDPILAGPMRANANPSVAAVQAIRVLIYNQLDLPDICESCT